MTISQHETCRIVLEGLRKIIDRKDGDFLPVHHFGIRVATLSIKNETNLIGGENVGAAAEVDGGEAPSTDGDGDGDGDGDPDPARKNKTRKTNHQTAYMARDGLPAEGFVRLPQILAVIPVSKSSWYAGVKSGRYPAPVKLGPRTSAWHVSDVRVLIEFVAKMPGIAGLRDSECVLSSDVAS